MAEDNKRKQPREAVALEYDAHKGAPRVVAAGKGLVAERIIETAIENMVPVHEDPELAHALNVISIGEEIPPELYQVVAQVLVFVADLDKRARPALSKRINY